jgi:uncharacterized protein (DUF1778 family)
VRLDYYGKLPYIYLMTMQHSDTARLEARMPADAYAILKRAAAIQGRSITDFVVTAASEAARKTIEETDILRLSAEDQRRVADLLLSPPPPSPALVRAAERYRQRVDNS